MSVAEMKWAIVKSLDKLPEHELEELLSFINKAEKSNKLRYDINSEIENVLHEDEELLNRLAK